jgi:hypothetical protein
MLEWAAVAGAVYSYLLYLAGNASLKKQECAFIHSYSFERHQIKLCQLLFP